MVISDFSIGKKIEMKKPHPCGGKIWEVVRTGADFKVKCLSCGRIVMLTPDELLKRTKGVKED